LEQKHQNKIKDSISDDTMSSAVYARFYSFFLLPLMVAVLGSLFFIGFKSITEEDNDFSKLISDINDGSHSKRWHAAYRLGVELSASSDSEAFPDEQHEKDMLINTYKNSIDYEKSISKDNKDKYNLRSYLTIAMGKTKDTYYGEVLLDGLTSKSSAIRLSTIQSLGEIQYKPAAKNITDIINFTNCCKENPGINTITCCVDDIEVLTAVIALGKISDTNSIPLLKKMLNHEQPNIIWDSAIALAKMGDNSGKTIINDLLNRKFYHSYKNINEEEMVNTILVAVQISSELKDPIFEENLNYLASSLESNPDIRNAAKMTIKKIYN